MSVLAKALRIAAAAALALDLTMVDSASAKTTGVVEDPALQSGPCYEALIDRNAANPTTAPNRELGSACEAEHGDVDKAWARVIRLWGSDSTDVPDYDSYIRPDAGPAGAAPAWLAWIGVLLTSAVLLAPMRSAARVLGVLPGPARGAGLDLAVSLIARALITAILIGLFSLPFLGALGAAGLAVWAVARLRQARATPAEAVEPSFAAHLAETINDALGASAGLATLALFIQHNGLLFVVGLLLSVVVSVGPVIAARRQLRAPGLRSALGAAALAAALGEAFIYEPPVSGWIGGVTGAALLAPVVFAALALTAGLALGRAPKT